MEEIKEGKVYTDPKKFTEADLPLIVLADDLRGFIGYAIKSHTKGNYNHAFIMHRPGFCVSQDFGGFKEHPIEVYLTEGMMLKFWKVRNLTLVEKSIILLNIKKRLGRKRWQNSYDFLGVLVGQVTRLRWIQNPFQMFCSEQVRWDFLKPLERAIKFIRQQPSPADLDASFKPNPNVFIPAGYWWSD